jgi:uroporphyrinogen decarboxylase
MRGRDRILKALNHEEPDHLPIDVGGLDVDTLMVGPYRRLCEYLQVDPHPIYMPDIMEQTVIVNDLVADRLGCNTHAKVIYFLPKTWREGQAYDGTPVMLPDGFRPLELPDGSQVVVDAEGNHDMIMPKGGYFFDVARHPLQNVEKASDFDRHISHIENFDRSSWADLPWNELALYVKDLKENEDKFLVGTFQGHIFQAGQILRGWSDFMLDLAARPSFAEALMDRIAEGHMQAFAKYADTVAKHLDVIEVADDLGIQHALWMSPETYRKHVKPYHAKFYGFIKDTCDCRLLMHSDGSLYPIIPDLIEIGVDILNPIQYTAKDMELAKLKKEFGDDLSFWGAGMDTQTTLPFGTPQEIADEVRRNIDILAPGGGFIFASVHNITEGVPTENIITAYQTAVEHGKY